MSRCGCGEPDEKTISDVSVCEEPYGDSDPRLLAFGGATGVTQTHMKEMNSRAPYIGVHLHLEKKTADASLTEVLMAHPEITDVQIFTHGPRSMAPTKAYDGFEAVAAFRKIRIWTHGSYLCIPWKSPALSAHTLHNIQASARLGSRCVVAHIPFAPVDSVVSGITSLVKHMRSLGLCETKLMLETSASKQDDLRSYESPEKLNRLTKALFDAGYNDCVRICVDTAHIFAGRAKISSYEDALSWWNKLDTRLIGMIHLNGSSHDPDLIAGDKHEVPMGPADLIWGQGTHAYTDRGCRAFINNGRTLGIPIILEMNPKRHSSKEIQKFIKMTAA